LHRDYQGSILAITNETGAIVEKRQFDAWGAIVKVQDGTGNILNGLTILDRGYTGHEHLQSVGLIHMNGRLYDPKLHRFLQPDNYVQDPNNTQNYNRYGYVLNNPLKYTDPSGEFKINWNNIIAGVAIAVGTVLSVTGVGTVVGAALIGAGVAHFGAAYAEYTKTGDWNAASNNAGISFSTTIKTDWGYGESKDKQNGIIQSESIVKPNTLNGNQTAMDNSGGNWAINVNSTKGSLPCTGDCDGWMGTEYIGPTPVATYYKKQTAVDMVDLAAQKHDAGYILMGADGISGALFDLSVLKYDLKLYNDSKKVYHDYYNYAIDSQTRQPISFQTQLRAAAVMSAFGPIVQVKQGLLNVRTAYQDFIFSKNQFFKTLYF
jgi:RHS repeat-associated protein